MRLFIHDVKTRKFKMMIQPIVIESCTDVDFLLYVTDIRGAFYTLRFPSHELLKSCLVSLRDKGYCSTVGDLEYYIEIPEYETGREIEITESEIDIDEHLR